MAKAVGSLPGNWRWAWSNHCRPVPRPALQAGPERAGHQPRWLRLAGFSLRGMQRWFLAGALALREGEWRNRANDEKS